MFSCLLSGCSKPKKHSDDDKKEKEEKPLPSLAIGGGDTTIYGSATATAPSFSVRWKAGQFDAAKGTVSTGHLEQPEGEIFSNGKASSTYRADTGDANRELKRLDMRGDVVLRSADGKQTLKAPAAQYRGDVKIIRATGGVVATGTFGTLSGVPELWATPDLKTLGTPDMVSQKLRLPALAALAATAAIGSAHLQKGTTYDFDNQGPTLAENLPTGLRLTVKPLPGKPLVVRIPERKIVLESAGPVVVEFAPGKSRDVRRLTTQGRVHVVQTKDDGTATTLDGRDAVYDWDWKAQASTSDLDLAGPVTLVRDAKVKNGAGVLVTQTTTAEGAKGSAVLVNKPKGAEDGLKQAVLTGDVHLDVSEVDGESFKGAGQRLVYTPSGETNGVTLNGGTTMTRTSKGPDGTSVFVARGARGSAVLYAKPAPGANPAKSAVLEDDVKLNVTGSNNETFKGSGDRVVYTAEGDGGRAVMTGDLKFTGDAAEFAGDLSNVNTAVIVLSKKGWETIETRNTNATPTTTRIQTKQPPAVKPPAKGKKRGKP